MSEEYDNTEKKIIKATFELLQEVGLQKTTTKKIAKQAGVNEVTVFRKFDNKKNLVEATKNYYMNILISKLEDIFDFTGDEEIEDYIKRNFYELLHLPDEEFSVIKLAMEEVRDITNRKLLISRITSAIILKIKAFFEAQIEKGKVRDIDSTALSVMVFSITFQSIVLWKVYNEDSSLENHDFTDSVLDALMNGIKA